MIILIIGVIIVGLIAYNYNQVNEVRKADKVRWNNGVCPHCGEKWKLKEYDQYLGRIYECENGHETNVITNEDDNYLQ